MDSGRRSGEVATSIISKGAYDSSIEAILFLFADRQSTHGAFMPILNNKLTSPPVSASKIRNLPPGYTTFELEYTFSVLLHCLSKRLHRFEGGIQCCCPQSKFNISQGSANVNHSAFITSTHFMEGKQPATTKKPFWKFQQQQSYDLGGNGQQESKKRYRTKCFLPSTSTRQHACHYCGTLRNKCFCHQRFL